MTACADHWVAAAGWCVWVFTIVSGVLLFIINTKLVWIVSTNPMAWCTLWMARACQPRRRRRNRRRRRTCHATEQLLALAELTTACTLMHLHIARCSCPASAQVRYVTRGGRVHTLKPVCWHHVHRAKPCALTSNLLVQRVSHCMALCSRSCRCSYSCSLDQPLFVQPRPCAVTAAIQPNLLLYHAF